MKKLNKHLPSLIVLSLLLAACSEDNGSPTEKVPVVIVAGIDTRAINNEWEAGDAIGVTMYQKEEESCMEGCFNIQYLNRNNGSQFTSFSNEAMLYFPEDGSEVTFKSYYPYKDDLNDDLIYPLTLENQESLPAIDFMTAEHLQGSSLVNPTVRMQFYHRLSKLIFILCFQGENPAGYEDFDLIVKGMKTAGSYDIEQELLWTDENGYHDIIIPLREEDIENNKQNKRMGIVFPRPAGSGVSIVLTTPAGAYYTGSMDPELELKEGYEYVIKILISGNGGGNGNEGEPLTLEIVTIEPWTDGGEYTLEAN